MEKALLEKAVSLAPLILKVHMSHESFDFLFFFFRSLPILSKDLLVPHISFV